MKSFEMDQMDFFRNFSSESKWFPHIIWKSDFSQDCSWLKIILIHFYIDSVNHLHSLDKK